MEEIKKYEFEQHVQRLLE